jgi:transcriptional regulator with XRE-family HTH domain
MHQKPLKPAATYAEILGRIIVHFRKERGVRQEELAQAIGVSQSAWSRIETGASPLTVTYLARVASVLRLESSDILQAAERVHKQLTVQGVQVQLNDDQHDKGLLFLGAAALTTVILAIMSRR